MIGQGVALTEEQLKEIVSVVYPHAAEFKRPSSILLRLLLRDPTTDLVASVGHVVCHEEVREPRA